MRFRCFLIPALAMSAACAFGQALPRAEMFPIERYYQYPLLNGRSPSNPQMSPDGSKIVYGWNKTGTRKLDLWVMDYPSGNARMIAEASKFTDQPRQEDTRTDQEKKESELYDGGIGGATWSPDGKELLFGYKGRSWFIKPDGSGLRPVFDGGMVLSGGTYSPDGKYITFNNGANLFRYERSNGFVKQLTFIGKPNQSISGHTWSPDSKNIAVFWQDDSKLGSHVMMDFSKDKATVVSIRRMWNGELSQDNQVGFIPADGGVVRFVPGIPRYSWILDSDWAPNGKSFAVSWLKDDFKEHTITVVDPEKNEGTAILKEVAPKNYIPDWRPLVWTRDSKHILFGTDILDGKFGFRSVMQMDPDGKNVTKFFAENYDVASLTRPKNSDRIFLSTLSKSTLKSEITIVEPNGDRTVHNVIADGMSTPKNFDDMASPLISDDGKMVATVASSRKLNPELYAVEPKQTRLTRSQLPDFDKIHWADFKEVSFTAPDGATIHGLLITKPGLDMTEAPSVYLEHLRKLRQGCLGRLLRELRGDGARHGRALRRLPSKLGLGRRVQ